MKKILLLISVLFCNYTHALDGLVVSVADGDTLTILDVNKTQHRIRLAQIDAPEKAQPWGDRSKQSLIAFAAGKRATVNVSEYDRYGRAIGTVYIQGQDAGTHQVTNGLAWVYPKYATDKVLFEYQRTAKAAKIGLWQDSNPIEPWIWRKGKK